MIEFLQQLINGLSLGAIYALIALGYTMVYGVLCFINFAHGDVFMIGAFAGLYVAPIVLKFSNGGPSWPGAFLVLVVAMVICAILGVVIEKLAYRPLRNRPRLTVLITAIGVSLFLENFGQYAFGVDPQSFPGSHRRSRDHDSRMVRPADGSDDHGEPGACLCRHALSCSLPCASSSRRPSSAWPCARFRSIRLPPRSWGSIMTSLFPSPSALGPRWPGRRAS